jgi:8-oxo-dGTP diphosphatase / 2-hydroxy-dATP diphosphatase
VVNLEFDKSIKEATVVFLINKQNEVLLAKKTRFVGEGRWNGYGGGIEEGESPEMSAIRELFEETNGAIVFLNDLEKIAVVDCHHFKLSGVIDVCQVHFFIAKNWQGQIKESIEMIRPTWFAMSNLPWYKMIPTDKDWLPQALAGNKVRAKVYLGPFQKEKLKETDLWIVENF